MPNMRTEYLGLDLPHPLTVGAGPLARSTDSMLALEDAGASAITLPSLYEEQLRAESIATYQSVMGSSDSFGEASSFLPSPDEFVLGPEQYLDHLHECAGAVRIPVIASLNGAEAGPWLDYAGSMHRAGASAIELNLYEIITSPNDTAQSVEDRSVTIVRELRARTPLPIAVKLSPFYTSLPNVATRLIDAGASGLILFNRFFEPDVDADRLEHVPHLALSTPAELLLRLRWLSILSERVGGSLGVSGGVHGARDAVRAIMCGASAVQLVSTLIANGPSRLTTILRELEAWLDEHEYESVSSMRGCMGINRCPDPATLTRAQYIRTLQTWRPA